MPSYAHLAGQPTNHPSSNTSSSSRPTPTPPLTYPSTTPLTMYQPTCPRRTFSRRGGSFSTHDSTSIPSTIPEDLILEWPSTSTISPFSPSSTQSPASSTSSSPPSSSPSSSLTNEPLTPTLDRNYDLKSTLTHLLNSEAVRADAQIRAWVQARLMDAELELKRQRRRRRGASGELS